MPAIRKFSTARSAIRSPGSAPSSLGSSAFSTRNRRTRRRGEGGHDRFGVNGRRRARDLRPRHGLPARGIDRDAPDGDPGFDAARPKELARSCPGGRGRAGEWRRSGRDARPSPRSSDAIPRPSTKRAWRAPRSRASPRISPTAWSRPLSGIALGRACRAAPSTRRRTPPTA